MGQAPAWMLFRSGLPERTGRAVAALIGSTLGTPEQLLALEGATDSELTLQQVLDATAAAG